jgi:hypothetical protein
LEVFDHHLKMQLNYILKNEDMPAGVPEAKMMLY